MGFTCTVKPVMKCFAWARYKQQELLKVEQGKKRELDYIVNLELQYNLYQRVVLVEVAIAITLQLLYIMDKYKRESNKIP